MTAKLKFYKEAGRWYADVPGHTEEENEMVAGADELLNTILTITNSPLPEVNIRFTQDPREAKVILFLEDHDECGGYYFTFSPEWSLHGLKLWICNVTHDVLGEHPDMIMFTY